MSPPILPAPITLLMSDSTTQALANDVAQRLSSIEPSIYVDDFRTPLAEAVTGLFSLDWKGDLLTSAEPSRLRPDLTHADVVKLLEWWFENHFDSLGLGRLARLRYAANQLSFAAPFLFRDARPVDLAGFLHDAPLSPRDIVIVWLTPPSTAVPSGATHIHPATLDADVIVKEILTAYSAL